MKDKNKKCFPNDKSKVMNMKLEKHMHTNIAQKKKKKLTRSARNQNNGD